MIRSFDIRSPAYLFALATLLLSGCTTVPRAPIDGAAPQPGADRYDGPKLSVVITGATRAPSLEGKGWDDLRVGMGTVSVLAQALHDSGRFSLRETTPEIRSQLERTWRGPANAQPLAVDANVDCTAAVHVERFFVRDRSVFLGFAGSGRKQTHIDVTVELVDTRGGQTQRVSGHGTAQTGTSGVLFVYESGTVEFDETTIGKATRQAVYDAVSRITIP
jgi:hypothetical protein